MDFDFVNWGSLDQLTSRKLQRLADNDEYLDRRKFDVHHKSDVENKFIKDNVGIYAEYREISPGDEFPAKQLDKPTTVQGFFSKDIKFPTNYFRSDRDVTLILSVGSQLGTLLKVNSIATKITKDGFTLVVTDEADNNFVEGMKFFLNFFAIGRVMDDINNSDKINGLYPYVPQNFEYQERIGSDKLNNFVKNSDYLRTHKSEFWLRNVDPRNKLPRENFPMIKDNVVMHADYIEFTPGKAAKNEAGKAKTQFSKTFSFPSNFFNIQYQPVVVIDAGLRPEVDEFLKIMVIIRNITPGSFDVTFIDYNSEDETTFTNSTPMFLSYTAIGVKGEYGNDV